MIDFSNASVFKLKKVDASKFSSEMNDILIEDEKIIGCYQDVRDHVVFTNKRVIAVNVQGITGKKKDFTTLPYSKITAYSVETAGTFDLESELDFITAVLVVFVSSSRVHQTSLRLVVSLLSTH